MAYCGHYETPLELDTPASDLDRPTDSYPSARHKEYCSIEVVTQGVDTPDRGSDFTSGSSRVAGEDARMRFDI